MSIKEHLANQPGQPDRLHGLTLESEDRPELKFDVKRDITPEDWKRMMEQFEALRFSGHMWPFAANAFRLHLLDPTVDLGITDSVLHSMYGEFNNSKNLINKNWIDIASLAVFLRVLQPSRTLYITEQDWDTMIAKSDDARSNGEWLGFASIAASLRILNPTRKFDISDSDWKMMRNQIKDSRSPDNWLDFAVSASHLRFLDPSKALDISDSDFDSALARLDAFRNSNRWTSFIQLASSMRLLAAHDVRITAPGKIEITDHAPDFHTETPPRPERKIV